MHYGVIRVKNVRTVSRSQSKITMDPAELHRWNATLIVYSGYECVWDVLSLSGYHGPTCEFADRMYQLAAIIQLHSTNSEPEQRINALCTQYATSTMIKWSRKTQSEQQRYVNMDLHAYLLRILKKI
jgi:hypothetical protein